MGGLDQAFVAGSEGQQRRQTSVLVARITGDSNPSETSREESRMRCLKALLQAAEISGGRVLRQQRDTVLVLLGSPDAALAAAARMQAYAARSGSGGQYGVRIGLASGEVTQRNDDVQGDTVNRALQVSREARNGQILASGAIASRLSPGLQTTLGTSPGFTDEPTVHDVRWQDRTTELLALHKESTSTHPHTFLRLEYRGNTILRRREIEYVTFGRDPGSNIVVSHRLASRRHCTVSRQGAWFTLHDHSKNGTFLMVAGEGEVFVHTEAARLGAQGWICLGESGDDGDEVIQYKVLAMA